MKNIADVETALRTREKQDRPRQTPADPKKKAQRKRVETSRRRNK